MQITPVIPNAAGVSLERLAENTHVSEDDKVAGLSRQFEAVLLRQILSQAQKTVIQSDFTDDSAVGGIYQDMITSQLAEAISQTGALGLAKNLQADLTRQLKKETRLKTDLNIETAVSELIEALRDELAECGEMLALLDQQQESVMARAAEDVLRSAAAVNAQMARIQAARERRDGCRAEIACSLGQPAEASFAELIPALPQKFRIPVESLVRGNNELLVRVQQRARQNHLLLGRSLQLMQQLIDGLLPALGPATYNDAGAMAAAAPRARGLYEAVG